MKFLRVRPLAALVLCLGLMGVRQASAQLVTNGGFETGDFTGWNLANAQYTSVSGPGTVGVVYTLNPDQGSNFALLGSPTNGSGLGGAAGGGEELSQTITTTAGASYNFSFAYFIEPGGPNNFFTAVFGDTTVLNDLQNESFPSDAGGNVIWAHESFTAAASSSSTTVAFYSGNDPAYNGLDSVSVTRVPEPASLVLFGLGAVGLFAVARRRKA